LLKFGKSTTRGELEGKTMPNATEGLSLEEDGDGYVLSATDKAGTTSTVKLTQEQLLVLSQSAPLLSKHALSKLLPKGASVAAVVATPVGAFQVEPDALKANILLTLQSVTTGSLTFELSPANAHSLLERLFAALSEILLKPLKKQ
jgi:hypothetical protein